MAQLIRRNCPACNRDNHDVPALPHSPQPWELKACADCSFTYLESVPAYEDLSDELAWEKTYHTEADERNSSEPLRRKISAAIKYARKHWFKRDKLQTLLKRHMPTGHILDIGCGRGSYLARYPATYTPYGIEISRALAEDADHIAQQRGGRVLHNNAVDGVQEFEQDQFDAVIMSSFLEHESNPKALLSGVQRILKTGGLAIIKVPNLASWNHLYRGSKWCGYRYPDHVNYFTPDSLRQMCKQAGLDIYRCNWMDRQPTSDNMWLIASKPLKAG